MKKKKGEKTESKEKQNSNLHYHRRKDVEKIKSAFTSCREESLFRTEFRLKIVNVSRDSHHSIIL
jgi:hypothetical protein